MATYTITLINKFNSIAHSQTVQATSAQKAVEMVKHSVNEPEEWLVRNVVV